MAMTTQQATDALKSLNTGVDPNSTQFQQAVQWAISSNQTPQSLQQIAQQNGTANAAPTPAPAPVNNPPSTPSVAIPPPAQTVPPPNILPGSQNISLTGPNNGQNPNTGPVQQTPEQIAAAKAAADKAANPWGTIAPGGFGLQPTLDAFKSMGWNLDPNNPSDVQAVQYWASQPGISATNIYQSAAQNPDTNISSRAKALYSQATGHPITGATTPTGTSPTLANATLQDYVNAAKQTTADSTQLNRYNQVTPTGTQTWTQDANGNYTLSQNLTPDQQKLQDQNTQFSTGLAGTLNDNMSSVASQAMTPIDQSKLTASPTNAGMTTQDAMMARLAPEYDRQKQALDAQLTNQGLGIGSEAWNNAQKQFGQTMNDAYTQAGLMGVTADQNARSTQIQQETALANQPLNAFNSLRTGMAAPQTTFNNTSTIAAPDYLGATTAANANTTATNNANIASNNSTQNGLFGLIGTGITAYAGMPKTG